MDINNLIKLAIEYKNNSYSKYSNFKVGAVIVTKDNKIIGGTNIENISYGLTNCAERSAIFSYYSQGLKKEDIKYFCVVADTNDIIYPCGACLQVMFELLPQDVIIILSNSNYKYKEFKLTDLLPYGFCSFK